MVGGLTFEQIQQLTSDWLDDPKNGYFTLPILKIRINLALKELQKHLISANEQYYATCVVTQLVPNQMNYAVPEDFYQVLRLDRITGGQNPAVQSAKIRPITPNQRDLVPCTTGYPDFYWMEKNEFMLWPVPQAQQVLRLEYSYLVQDMVNQGDYPDAPPQFHEYIPVLAARDCFIKDSRPLAPIESKMLEYRTLLKQIAEQRRSDAPRMVVATEQGYSNW